MVRFTSFRDFYPWYLGEHSDPVCRRLHIVGTALALAAIGAALATRRWWLLLAGALAGCGLGWLGHSRFERNRPATFSYPLYSLLGDLAMFRDVPRCSAPPDPVAPDPFPGTRA
jgi:hypothetical protein